MTPRCDKDCGAVMHMTGGRHRTDCAAYSPAVDPAEALRELRFLVGTYLEGSDDAVRAAELLDVVGAYVPQATVADGTAPGYSSKKETP